MTVPALLLIQGFSKFLNLSWSLAQASFQGDDAQDAMDDWLQANWELLIERGLGVGVFLEAYGNGADCCGASSRITFSEELPTHSIVCKSKIDEPLNDIWSAKKARGRNSVLVFDRLVSRTSDGWYAEAPPFDKVLCLLDGDEVILDLGDLEFSVVENANLS